MKIFQKSNIMLLENKKGFTLVELIISLILSSIILIFLMNFISNVFEEITYQKNKTNIINNIYKFQNILGNIRNECGSGYILKNNETGTGSDILIFRTEKDENVQKGYLIAMISNNTLKIDGETNIDNISDKVLAYRNLSETEMNTLELDNNKVYDILFYRDKIFKDIKLMDFQSEVFNSGSIINANFFINPLYKKSNDGKKYSEIGINYIERINLNF